MATLISARALKIGTRRRQPWKSEMSSDQIQSQVRAIMEDVFDVDDLIVTPTMTAEDIEEWDSLSHIRLIVAIERKFNIKFKRAEIESLKNVGDLVNLIGAKAA